MAIDRARAHLRSLGMEDRVMEFAVSSATVELAAQAVGCETARIAKTLSEAAEGRIGHAVGGACPYGVADGCNVYLDESLRRFDEVFPACGSANSAVRLSPAELAACTQPCTWVDVCKLPQVQE